MKKVALIYLTTILCFFSISCLAQVNNGLLTSLSAIAGMRDRFPIEKLYLQLDKPYYTPGDTLRFKAYLLNADFLKPSIRSKMLYVELDNNDSKCIKRIMVPLVSGISWGDIALDAKLPDGSYTIRAYTNWVLNFGEDYVFKKSIYVAALSNSTLIKADFKTQPGTDKDKILANLRFTGLDKKPVNLKDMELKIMNGKHNLIKKEITTGIDGSVKVDFDSPDKSTLKNLSILAQQTGKGADTTKLTIPVILNRPENTDVQFMPEGGNMVAGISTKVGFKAIGEDGRSVEITGDIYNSKQQKITSFKSVHKGIGSFELSPQAGETYTAKVNLPGKIIKTYPLPVVNPEGIALKIIAKGKDSLEINISASASLLSANYYLIAQTRGLVCYTALINFKGASVIKKIAKDLFPAGIAHFTLISNTNQPLNERIVYIDHDDNLKIAVTPDRLNYGRRDSVALAITINDKDGKPVNGSFSVAVTDNSQVKTDSTNSNIISNMLLSSDLKGTIEEPGYYLEENTAQRAAELDNLMLTQGWVGYDWKAIFNPVIQQPKFTAEPEFIVQGKVTNVFGKPVENSEILLFSRKPEQVLNTVTDKNGQFKFKGLFPVDTAEFKIQARNKKGESNNVGIEMMNEFKPPVFTASAIQQTPWYVNSDTVLLNNSLTKTAQLKAEASYRGDGIKLKEVVIKDKKPVKGSKQDRDIVGDPDVILDEQDLLKAGKMSLRQLLEKNVKGFTLGRIPLKHPDDGSYRMNYKIYDYEISRYSFDGEDIMDYYIPTPPQKIPHVADWVQVIHDKHNYIDTYLDYFSAEDITGLEVWFNGFGPEGFTAWMEITTRTKKGFRMKITPGTYLYKPLPFTMPKDFYRPRYTVKNQNIASGTDLRSTIHWEPRIVTDKTGKAIVTFYSGDKPVDYTVIVEGTDLNGDLGYKRQIVKAGSK